MPNGGTIFAGRAIGGTIFAGRGLSPLRAAPALNGGTQSMGIGTAAWPPAGRPLCAPVLQCCCKGPWNIGPGETLPMTLDWSAWLNTVPGYNLEEIKEASLWDMSGRPPVAADPDIIKVTTGLSDKDPVEPDNSDVASLISLIPPQGMHLLISASTDAVIGRQYKLDIWAIARDCKGREIVMKDCFVIVIAEC